MFGKVKEVAVNLPFGIGGVKFELSEAEKRAAWSLYVELNTRIAVRPFDRENSRVRTALDSLHSLFGLTRQVLRDSGPEVAHGPKSFGPLAIEILNKGIAPFTSRWHYRLEAHEEMRPENVSAFDHERSWKHYPKIIEELEALQRELDKYVTALSEIAGIVNRQQ